MTSTKEAPRTWHKTGRGKQTDEQRVTFRALMAMAPNASVAATLHARWDPMEVVLRDPTFGTSRWTIYADGYARPGSWLGGAS